MIASLCILPRRPFVAARRFGLLDTGWPVRRSARPARPAPWRVAAVERRYRSFHIVSSPPRVASGPVNIAVANLSLSPRFTLIWQEWRNATERHRRLVRETAPGADHTRGTVLRERPETLLERVSRIFSVLIPGHEVDPVSNALRTDTVVRFVAARSSSAGGVMWYRDRPRTEPIVRSALAAVDSSTRSEPRLVRSMFAAVNSGAHIEPRLARPRWSAIAGTRVGRRPGAHVAAGSLTSSETLGRRSLCALRCTVAQRRLRLLIDEPSRQSRADLTSGKPAAGRPDELSPPKQSAAPARRTAHHDHASELRVEAPHNRVGEERAAIAMTRVESTPAERVFRTEKPAQPRAPVEPAVARPVPATQVPQLDIAKLDTALWERFERRLRIEQERRGRG